MKKYAVDDKGNLTDQSTGEVYAVHWILDGTRFWGRAELAGGGYAVTSTGALLELVKEGADLRARPASKAKTEAMKKGAVPTFPCVSPAADEIEEPGEAAPAKPTAPAVVTFEGVRYSLDKSAMAHKVAVLPGGRYLTMYLGTDGEWRPAALLVEPPANFGLATTLDLAPACEVGIAPAVEAPPTLFVNTPDALDAAAAATEGVKINVPIYFYQLGTTHPKTMAVTLNPCRGIPLAIFRVPDTFGRPGEDEKDRTRHAAWVLTTADNVIVSDRDEKHFPVPKGTVVWVDVKHDLRGMGRYLPRFDGGRVSRAAEVFIQPLGKRPFPRIVNGKQETWSAWRVELYLRRIFNDKATMAYLENMATRVPVLPWEADAGYVEHDVQTEASDESDGEPVTAPAQ